MRFSGFSTQGFSFLQNLAANNNRDWFLTHKADFESDVKAPLQNLSDALLPKMHAIDPKLSASISRIYRDTRFSKDKTPYKTNQWITFKRPYQNWQNTPAWFFAVEPHSFCFGMGYFCAERATMDKIRASILEKPQHFLQEIAFLQSGQFAIEGECYKRAIKGDIPQALQDFYQRKSFYLIANFPARALASNFATDLMNAFETLIPLYDSLWCIQNQHE